MVALNISPQFSPEMLDQIRNNIGRSFPAGLPAPVSTPAIPANQPVTINQLPDGISGGTQQPFATGFENPVPLRAGGAIGESFFTGQQVPAIPISAPSPVSPAAPQVLTPEQIAAQQAEINAVPSGLIGAEAALTGGTAGSTEALLASLGVSRADIQAGGVGAQQRLEEARGGVATGTQQARQDILSGAATGRDIISGGTTTGVETIGRAGTAGVTTLEQGKTEGLDVLNRAFDDAVDPVTGFIDPGKQANTLRAALTGALGPDAQRAALADFQNDPSIKFSVEEAERALLRNTAAIGGLGGGNVRKELQRQAIGQAQKVFNDRIAQLGQVASTGLGAATTVSGLEATRGLAGTELIGRTATGVAQIGQTTAQDTATLLQSGALTEADIERNASNTIAQLTQTGAFADADIAGKQAQIERAIGQDLATLESTTGLNVAQTVQNLGSASAELRSQAGRDLAAAIATTTASLAAQQAAEGAGISDIVGADIGNIANLLVQEGLIDAGSQEQLATLLGNIAVGQGTTAGNIAANIGQIEAAGVLGINKAVQSGISGLTELLGEKK